MINPIFWQLTINRVSYFMDDQLRLPKAYRALAVVDKVGESCGFSAPLTARQCGLQQCAQGLQAMNFNPCAATNSLYSSRQVPISSAVKWE